MKILRVIASMNPEHGGPGQGIRNSIPEMKKHGVENEVVCFDAADAGYLGKDDFIIHAIGEARSPWAYNKALVPWLIENFERFDVVIIHGLWLYHGYATYKAWKKYKKKYKKYPKLFVMPHGMLDPYFQKAPDRKLKALRNVVYWQLIEKNIVNNVDGVLFTCEEELRLAREAFAPYKPKKELNVSYGIQPPPAFKEGMTGAFSEKVIQWNKEPFLLFLSRIHEKKGVDLLVKAYLKLEGENNLLPQLIIAGPLDSSYATQMQELAKPSNNILFAGMLGGDAKWGAFYNSQAFVLPSHQENFGIAVVEALACSKPVLTTNKVNIWREIEGGNGGFIETDTEDGAYNLLKNFVSLSYNQKEEMGNNAFTVYKTNFSIEEAAKTMLQEINKT